MTQPAGADLELIAAVVAETLRQQQAQGVAQLAPSFLASPTQPRLACRRCGMPADDTTWPSYVDHCTTNHHSLLERFAAHFDDAELDADLAAVTDPEPGQDAWSRLAADLRGRDWPENPQTYLGLLA